MNDPTKTTPFPRSDDAAATVRRAAFRALLEGEAVGREELAALTGLGTEAVGRALEDLAARGRVAIDAQGAVVASAGLSVVPSRHRLRLNGAEFHTWCAIDAIGIPAALGSDALAETACAHCGREMRVEIRGGRVAADAGNMAWDPGAAPSNVMEEYCPEANLFCGPEHLEAWRATHGNPPGRALTLVEVEGLGRDWWGDLR